MVLHCSNSCGTPFHICVLVIEKQKNRSKWTVNMPLVEERRECIQVGFDLRTLHWNIWLFCFVLLPPYCGIHSLQLTVVNWLHISAGSESLNQHCHKHTWLRYLALALFKFSDLSSLHFFHSLQKNLNCICYLCSANCRNLYEHILRIFYTANYLFSKLNIEGIFDNKKVYSILRHSCTLSRGSCPPNIGLTLFKSINI